MIPVRVRSPARRLGRPAVGLALFCSAVTGPPALPAQGPPRFEVTVPSGTHAGPLTGRLIVAVSTRADPEPRFLISPNGPAIFAIDLERQSAGRAAVVDQRALGYPKPLAELPPGEYTVQAVINVYDEVRRAVGPAVWLPMNDGTQEFFSTAAGNLYSSPIRVRLDPGSVVRLQADQVIPPAGRPPDTEWVKRVTIRSEKLTRFWGRPIFVHATVLLPTGYEDHPEVRYPVVFTLGHNVPFSFTTDSTRVRGRGQINPVSGLETGYDFYRAWVSDSLPRIVAISLEQQTPYFPDSYSVNSANNGPYGDAIVEEVIPELERRFRLIGKPYARVVEGASTGGWQALALQLQHPEVFGGAWVLQPDPIDFRKYQQTDLYQDTSAFALSAGQFTTIERPFRRTVDGQVVWSTRQLSLFEEVLGTRGRSGYQLGAWEAVFGPMGEDGYPKPLWNKLTGTIDREVAAYMRDHGFDLRVYAAGNWGMLRNQLRGKLHFFAGDMDDFYLNLAVYEFEKWLRSVDPDYPATFTYGRPTKGHSWHAVPWAELVRQIGSQVKATAPAGENPASWHY